MSNEVYKSGGNSNPCVSNLVPTNKRSPEEAFAIRSKGGQAARRATRAKKDFAYWCNELLNARILYPIGEVKGFEEYDKKFIDNKGETRKITVSQRIVLSMASKAIHGDVAAAQFIRDSAGQAPVKKIQADIKASTFDLDWGQVLDKIDEEAKEVEDEMEEGVSIDE